MTITRFQYDPGRADSGVIAVVPWFGYPISIGEEDLGPPARYRIMTLQQFEFVEQDRKSLLKTIT